MEEINHEIAIFSDSHGNLANIKKAIDWLKKENIKIVLHCGDIDSQEIMDEIGKDFEAKFVRGNADVSIKEDLPEIERITLGNKRIAFTHFPDIAESLAKEGKYDIIFYGHTHRPWEHKIGDCRLINPGELAGQFQKPTFAVYNSGTDKLELKILELLT